MPTNTIKWWSDAQKPNTPPSTPNLAEETEKERLTREYMSQQNKPAQQSPAEGETEKERLVREYMNQQKTNTPPSTPPEVDPYEQSLEEERQAIINHYDRLMNENRLETDKQKERRIKEAKKQAVMDALGGALSGMSNMIGGVTGGYSFEHKAMDKDEDPIAKARKERLERMNRYYEASHGRMTALENLNKKLRDHRIYKDKLAKEHDNQLRNDRIYQDKLAKEAEAAEEAKKLNNARIAESEARANYYNRKETDSNKSSTSKRSGGGRSGKINTSWTKDTDTSPETVWRKKHPANE